MFLCQRNRRISSPDYNMILANLLASGFCKQLKHRDQHLVRLLAQDSIVLAQLFVPTHLKRHCLSNDKKNNVAAVMLHFLSSSVTTLSFTRN